MRALTADDVEVRVGRCTANGVQLLLYKDARVDMRLLDEEYGPLGWQCRYEAIDGKLFCSVGVLHDGGWVWKSDVGTPSNMEADKGEASDAFKRACVKWGIGRELYASPFIWVDKSACRLDGANGRWKCNDRFAVTRMEVEGGKVAGLEVVNRSMGGAVCFTTYGRDGKAAGKNADAARDRLRSALRAYTGSRGGDPKSIWRVEVKAARDAGKVDDAAWWDARAAEYERMAGGAA